MTGDAPAPAILPTPALYDGLCVGGPMDGELLASCCRLRLVILADVATIEAVPAVLGMCSGVPVIAQYRWETFTNGDGEFEGEWNFEGAR